MASVLNMPVQHYLACALSILLRQFHYCLFLEKILAEQLRLDVWPVRGAEWGIGSHMDLELLQEINIRLLLQERM